MFREFVKAIADWLDPGDDRFRQVDEAMRKQRQMARDMEPIDPHRGDREKRKRLMPMFLGGGGG